MAFFEDERPKPDELVQTKKAKLCHCGEPMPAHETTAAYFACRKAHQQPKREVWLVDRVTTASETRYEPHVHKAVHLGMMLAGPLPSGLLIDRAQMRLCETCHLVYWEQLEAVAPSVIQK